MYPHTHNGSPRRREKGTERISEEIMAKKRKEEREREKKLFVLIWKDIQICC